MANVWLLDVDGVINAVCHRPAEHHRRFVANGFPITYDPAITSRLLHIHTSGLAELRWLTTWEELANVHLIGELGWPRLELAGARPATEVYGWWKSEVAEQVYLQGHRVVWTDDDLGHSLSLGYMDWVSSADPDRLLAISPSFETGLTLEEMDRAEEWLQGRSPREDPR